MTGQLIEFPGKQKPEMPTLDGIMDEYEKRITQAILDPASEAGNETLDYIGLQMARACHPGSKATFDSLFEYVAIAHGLHAGAEAVRTTNPAYADEMAGAGQLFLSYAVCDIGSLMSKTGKEAFGLQ